MKTIKTTAFLTVALMMTAVACDSEDFKTTKLYQSIKQWADSKGVTVLLD